MDEMIPGRKVSDLERMTELLAPVEQVYPLTDMEVEAIRDLAHQQDVAERRAVWQATVDALLGHSATLTTERDRLREALQRMCFAYAGEMAARTAGVDIKGFPLLDAYQHAHFVLYGEDEPSERALAGTGETPFGATLEGEAQHD